MTIYKLKVLTCAGDDEKSILKDFYLDVETISGFFVPVKHEEDSHIEGEFITVIHQGNWTNILQERHIVEYLTNKYVIPSLLSNSF